MIRDDVYRMLCCKEKHFFLLIDPGKHSVQSLMATLYAAEDSGVSCILVGGSLISEKVDYTVEIIKKYTSIPVLLFPGSLMQLSDKVDAVLLLSLISGRNPEYLIGNHVLAAPYLKKNRLEVIPTGYILIGEGDTTSVEYISNTKPIPPGKSDIVIATAIAGEMMGNKLIYLESGSGAGNSISSCLVSEVKKNIDIPLIVGGGIRNTKQVKEISEAGADIIVVGNAVEKDPGKLECLVKALQ